MVRADRRVRRDRPGGRRRLLLLLRDAAASRDRRADRAAQRDPRPHQQGPGDGAAAAGIQKEIGTLEAQLEALKPILPDERDVGDLLRRVQTLATQSNLQVRGFKPQAITTKEMHAEWPIALQLEGNYHNLGLFLDRVSKFPRIINIGNMQLAAKPTGTPDSSMTIQATATTFVLVDAAAAEADRRAARRHRPRR